jgi:membrane protein
MKKTLKMRFSNLWAITKKTVSAWIADDPFGQSAKIAYYAIFSIVPLLVIVIALAGMAFGQERVQEELSTQIGDAMGDETAKQIEEMIAKASERKKTVWATILGIVTLLVGCTGVFAQLQVSLNNIWEVRVEARKKWLRTLRDRLFSFGMVMAIGFLLMVSLLITAALAALSGWIKAYLPDFMLGIFFLLNFLVSFGVITVLFALMYKVLPDAEIRWRNVWVGAMVTALLFILGKFLIGVYFGKADPGSAYGAAGSIVLIMLWVSYSCMIVFLGAEFTKQYTLHRGDKIIPRKDAVLIDRDTEKQRVKDKHEAVREEEKKDRKTGSDAA